MKDQRGRYRLDPDLDTDCYVLYVQAGDLAKARLEINRSPSDFSSFMLGQVLLREGKVQEAMARLQPIPAGDPDKGQIRR